MRLKFSLMSYMLGYIKCIFKIFSFTFFCSFLVINVLFFTEGQTDLALLEWQLDPRGPIAPRVGSVPVFLKKL